MDSILSAHITHKQARMADIEKLGELDPSRLMRAAISLPGVNECIALRTCNRVEIYLATEDINASRKGLEDLVNGLVPFDIDQNLVQYLSGRDSVKHILRVASGLESMIIGEDQIQSQVKEAYERAEREGTVGPMLSIVFRKAISVGKKVRTETRLNKGCVSIGTAAVELAEEKLGTLKGKNILVVGAGEMATLVAKHLVGKEPMTVFVSNRTYSRAVELAWVLNGKAVRFDNFVEFISQADVVLVATSATHMVLTRSHMEKAMASRTLESEIIVIDVSFPRNVEAEVAELPGVEYFDIDGLRGKAEENLLKRRAEIRSAEKIITSELESVGAHIKEMRANELLGRLYGKYAEMKEREVRKALNRLSSGKEPADAVLQDLADVMTKKFLADPTKVLKEAFREGDEEIIEIIEGIFRLDGVINVSSK
ncbi:MAG: glutamyl-tRNA reductase [Methanomassiliicoccus sp.]|nr:glutamyl-tRNA reductase [Methanomassiliicoccus sp.]